MDGLILGFTSEKCPWSHRSGWIESFRRFEQLENEIEPIEQVLEGFALAVYRLIQLLVDQARGKMSVVAAKLVGDERSHSP
jgi:hypothetical protein